MANPAQRFANVVTLPVRTAGSTAVGAARTLRDWSRYAVDDWGRDPDFVARVFTASRLRWAVSVGGSEHVPARSGALIVVNARQWALAPVFAALALGDVTGRPVRFVGRPDIAPIGPLMQRLGGLLPIEAELEGALRAGELVVLGAAHTPSNAACGAIDHRLVGAAVAAGVTVVPGVTISNPVTRAARVELGTPVRPGRIRRGPLAELELADRAELRIDAMLDEFGGSLTGTPLDWLALDRVLIGGTSLGFLANPISGAAAIIAQTAGKLLDKAFD
jgi:hypothetical protein